MMRVSRATVIAKQLQNRNMHLPVERQKVARYRQALLDTAAGIRLGSPRSTVTQGIDRL
jgi:hypothetical protein